MNKQTTPYLCHIFVCSNIRGNNPENPGCGAKGGAGLKDRLKEAVTARGWKGKVRVSTSGCMGLCTQGPNVLLYPQGIHFSDVTEANLPEILDAVQNLLCREEELLPAVSEEKKIWFPAKTFGWGWGPPVCWQGWVVLLIYIALLAAAPWLVPPHKTLPGGIAYVTGISAVLIYVCWRKGEKPRWRWGK